MRMTSKYYQCRTCGKQIRKYQETDITDCDDCTAERYQQVWERRLILPRNRMTCEAISGILRVIALGLIVQGASQIAWANGVAGQLEGNKAIIQVGRLADAIKKAENSKNHPYGILKPYCSGEHEAQCRKGCIQTIEKRLRMWDGEGDFIEYLGKSYSPPATNPHWLSNVRYFYNKGE